MPKQVTLNLKSLETAVKELEQIKEQISAHAGTASQRLAAAKASVLESVTVTLDHGIPKGPASYASVVELADALKAAAEQALDEAVTAHLRGVKDETQQDLSALREAFKAKAEAASALQTVLVSIIPEAKDVVIPTLKGTGRIGSGTGGGGKSSGQDFYIVRNGVRTSMAPSQNKYSSLAWYHGSEIGVPNCTGNKGKGCSKDELDAFLKGKGVAVSAGTPWSFKVSDSFTVGMDVIAPPAESEATE